MLQSDNPDDYVCATGVSHSVRDLCEYVFSSLGLDYNNFISIDEKHFRPEELHDLKGDSSKLRNELGWQPKWNLDYTLDSIVKWHRNWLSEKNTQEQCLQEIAAYLKN
jgi:GDPmannose 4,6-dehydratase